MKLRSRCRVCKSVGKQLCFREGGVLSEKCPLRKKRIEPRFQVLSLRSEQYRKRIINKRIVLNVYGIRESKLSKYVKQIITKETDRTLFGLLETRIDTLLYRSGLAKSIAHAKQLVNHKLVLINDRKADSPSIILKKGNNFTLKCSLPEITGKINYEWIIREQNKFVLIDIPTFSQIATFDEKIIKEHYSGC